ncbi:hypothetical protein BU24DRAFT_233624 [Aaosphaeria arxii CBS 175.79]|uniref:DUF676 domain-containing protein n=1 Tax=Aaosphaeria arxii CBS 175.79 TaxID=1450172 RepID=A0A6A5XKC4_9PLEO|nr:uncharacterized protein BU24DRAFT_233624 [Aaosphaeria arxii CBS 175.79]KAF2013267.1 hypothetical protein BU24DRAFT_233624 [Aaosphaeria arxii CBS 175.79]
MGVEILPLKSDTFKYSPIPYTSNPLRLCWHDILLFWRCRWSLFGILFPFTQWNCRELDELYPFSVPNVLCLALHGFLIILQFAFLISLPLLIFFPLATDILYVAVIAVVTFATSRILNGRDTIHRSTIGLNEDQHSKERWIYMNGVSVGKHWFQGNLDRLAMTFRRPVTGVHNPTYGVIFDLIQCIIERNFCYSTFDVRHSYALIKQSILDEKYDKVIVIFHSQGGIQGSLMMDWLYAELAHDMLQKLEIYTFASAANHFNNPRRSSVEENGFSNSTPRNAVRHIEHYAHDGDFVSRWGVLNFSQIRNRYEGRVFIRSGMGHLLNQHYLNVLFVLDENKRVLDQNDFMDSEITVTSEGAEDKAKDGLMDSILNGGKGGIGAIVEDPNALSQKVTSRHGDAETFQKKLKVKDYSRLWKYRNGGSPED